MSLRIFPPRDLALVHLRFGAAVEDLALVSRAHAAAFEDFYGEPAPSSSATDITAACLTIPQPMRSLDLETALLTQRLLAYNARSSDRDWGRAEPYKAALARIGGAVLSTLQKERPSP